MEEWPRTYIAQRIDLFDHAHQMGSQGDVFVLLNKHQLSFQIWAPLTFANSVSKSLVFITGTDVSRPEI